MTSENDRGHKDSKYLSHVPHKRKRHNHRQGAKTFRRGRAITFLERMKVKRSTLKKQLETPELQSIHPILVGELKALDMVISEFIQLFELYEFEIETGNDEREKVEMPSIQSEGDK